LKKIQKARTDIGKIPEEVKSLEKLLEDITNEISNL
jgi:archaellum component FlaC